MTFWWAMLAAAGVALCNGVANVLQKMSADKEQRMRSAHVSFLWRLLKDWPYVLGTAIDLVAWVLTIIAVHSLPLFVVQPIVAFSVVVTALIERFFFRRRLGGATAVAMGVLLCGLVLLASSATTESARPVAGAVRLLIILAPLALAAMGTVFARKDAHHATIALAAISGAAFGGTAIAGRMLVFHPPYEKLLITPLFIALVAYAFVGILMFTLALQRHHASVVNAAMIAFETTVPILIGIVFLGDRPKHGAWLNIIVGVALAMAGTMIITIQHRRSYPTKK